MRTAERTRVSAVKGGHARCQTHEKYNNVLPNGTLKKTDEGAIKTSEIKYLKAPPHGPPTYCSVESVFTRHLKLKLIVKKKQKQTLAAFRRQPA